MMSSHNSFSGGEEPSSLGRGNRGGGTIQELKRAVAAFFNRRCKKNLWRSGRFVQRPQPKVGPPLLPPGDDLWRLL
jgi:hypothetical protein